MAAEEQRMGISLISKEIKKVLLTSSDNTTLSSQVEHQSKQLNTFVDQLNEMIENWKTPELF